jgi:PAS domain S-box-containing protein
MNTEDRSREQLAAEVLRLQQRLSELEDFGKSDAPSGETLSTALERLRAVFAGSADPILITDLKDIVLEFNPAMTRVFGYTAEDLVGWTFPGHIGIDEGKFEEWLAICREGGGIRGYETIRRHKDGTLIPVSITVSPVAGPGGDLRCLSFIYRDITERKEVERRMRESEARLRSIIDTTRQSYILVDTTGRIQECNRRVSEYTQRMFGRALRVGECIYDYPFVSHIPNALEYGRRALEGEACSFESSFAGPDGQEAYVSFEFSPVYDDGGRVTGACLNARDITERKRDEQALQDSRQRLAQTMEATQLGWWDHDYRTGRIHRSPRWAEMLGYRPEEIGDSFEDWKALVHPEDLASALKTGKDHTEGLTPAFAIEHRLRTKAGGWKWVYNWGRVVERDEQGKPLRVTGIHMDIDERKQAERSQLYRVAFERLLAPISTRLINMRFDEIDDEINRTLGVVGEFVGADRSGVLWLSDDMRSVLLTHEWRRGGIAAPPSTYLPARPDEYADLYRRLNNAEIFNVASVEKLPPELAGFSDVFAQTGTRSFLIVPLLYGGALAGILTFGTAREETTWSDDTVSVLRNVGEIITSAIGRQRAEAALRKSEEFARAVIEHSPIGISVRSTTGKLLSANAAWKQLWATTDQGLEDDLTRERQQLEFDKRDRYLGDWQPAVRQVYEQGGYLHIPELKLVNRRDGIERWVSQRFYAIKNSEGHVERVVILTDDITDAKHTEEALRISEQRFRLLAENVPGVIYLCRNDPQYPFVYLSDKIRDLTGYPKEMFLDERITLTELMHPDDRDYLWSAISSAVADRKSFQIVYRVRDTSGKWRWIEEFGCGVVEGDSTSPVFLEGFLHDITERKLSEDKLREAEMAHQIEVMHADRLHTIGRLAAGVAHEINNPLAVLYGTLQEIAATERPSSRIDRQTAEQLLRVTNRIKDTVNNLLAFSRQRTTEKAVQNVNTIVEDTLSLVGSMLSKNRIHLTTKLADAPLSAAVNAEQIKQVVLNLVLNAMDAMPQGGELSITSQARPDAVVLNIKDTGTGVPPEDQEKIFTPFFTTKEVGRGTGLGLSICYGIIKEHGGTIKLISARGQGAEFVIVLPRV